MKYKLALDQIAEGNSVRVPGLPGYWSEGKTEEEALDNIRAATLSASTSNALRQ